MGIKNRLKRRRQNYSHIKRIRECPNCKQKLGIDNPGHFVPPSYMQKGFYICEIPKALDNHIKILIEQEKKNA